MTPEKRAILLSWITESLQLQKLRFQVQETLTADEGKFNEVVESVERITASFFNENELEIKTGRDGFQSVITVLWVDGKRSKRYQFNRGMSIIFNQVNCAVEIYFGGNRLDPDMYHSSINIPGLPLSGKSEWVVDLATVEEIVSKAIKPSTTGTAKAYDCTISGGETAEEILNKPRRKRPTN